MSYLMSVSSSVLELRSDKIPNELSAMSRWQESSWWTSSKNWDQSWSNDDWRGDGHPASATPGSSWHARPSSWQTGAKPATPVQIPSKSVPSIYDSNLRVSSPRAVPPSHCSTDDAFWDSKVLGGHQFHRTAQPTAWRRKAGIAGRQVDGLKLHELSYHGIQEYSLRLLSEGRFQGLVYTKSVAETIFVQALLKATREAARDLDRLAAALHSDGPPDTHKEAVRFVTPLVTWLVSLMQELSPSTGSSGEAAELKRRREKMQSLGINLRPRKTWVLRLRVISLFFRSPGYFQETL